MNISLVQKIKQIMAQELESDPDMTDKEYEALFVKYYMYYMDKGYIHSTVQKLDSKGKSRV